MRLPWHPAHALLNRQGKASKPCRFKEVSMKIRLQNIMIAIVATIAAAALAAVPATAKDSKKTPPSHKSAAAAAASMGHVPTVQEAPKKGQHDEKPGPAWRT